MQSSWITCWIARLTLLVVFLLTIRIFHREQRKLRSNDESNKASKRTSSIIVRRSAIFIFAMYMICSFLLLSTTFIQICKYTQPIADAFIAIIKLSLTMFQIVRLQGLLSTKQTIYGYSTSFFVTLYVFGICIFAFTCVLIHLLVYPVPADDFQCLSFQFSGLSRTGYSAQWYMLTSSLFAYITWDMIVLLAFIKKLSQLARKTKANQHTHRIEKALAKIIILTLVYESSFVVYIIFYYVQSNEMIGGYLIELKILYVFDLLFSMAIMCLMQEHNDVKYVKLAFMLKRSNLCCCCGLCLNFKLPVDKGKDDEDLTTATTMTIDIYPNVEELTTPEFTDKTLDTREITITQTQMTDQLDHTKTSNNVKELDQECDSQRTDTQEIEERAKINKQKIAALKKAIL